MSTKPNNKIQLYDAYLKTRIDKLAKEQNRSVNYIGCRLLEKALKEVK